MLESDLKKLVEQVIMEMSSKGEITNEDLVKEVVETINEKSVDPDEGKILDDILDIKIKTQLLVENPYDREGYLKMKEKTPSRIGIGRCGARYKTATSLRFRGDHAAAQDAVFNNVSEEFLKEVNLISFKTKCCSKDEFITRPDLGREFDDETYEEISKHCKSKPRVQIFVSDGLSSTAIEANVKDVLPAIIQGLKGYNIEVGTPFFVKYGRVGAMDRVSKALEAEVTCVLIGERPGLITSESMSAYIAYKAEPNMSESRRTVLSNIHSGGTPPVEAGAHIAEIIKIMLERKCSGVDLKL